jgi:Sulfotransferase family
VKRLVVAPAAALPTLAIALLPIQGSRSSLPGSHAPGSYRRIRSNGRAEADGHHVPILVTGSHRSGTGWTSRMISAASSVAEITEPFNLRRQRPGILNAKLTHWFPYVCSDNEQAFVSPMHDMLAFRYRPMAELIAVRSAKDVGRLGRDWYGFAQNRRIGRRPLVKDPIAFFSAAWLADSFGMDVIALTRHPAGFALSLKRLGWNHPFEHFSAQSLLIRDYLWPFESEIEEAVRNPPPILDQAVLLWRLIHHVMLEYRRTRPGWAFYRLEDVAKDPVGSFQHIYERLGLPFDQYAQRVVIQHSDPANPRESRDPSDVKRDSRRSVWLWKDRLTQAEIDYIRTGVEDISGGFYSDADW